MSYDVYIFKFAVNYACVNDIPKDCQPVPMGLVTDVRAAIDAIFGPIDWSDPTYGLWGSDMGLITFSLGKDDPVTGITLKIRAGDSVVPGVVQLCNNNGWQGIDGSGADEFIEKSLVPELGLQAWRAYRDQVMK